MSNLKDNDLDDLFRRASDKYPLRTDTSDWDRMAAALEKDAGASQGDDPGSSDRRRRRRFLWLLLLLPLAGAGYFALRGTGSHPGVAITPAGTTTSAGSTTSAGAKTVQSGTTATTSAAPGHKSAIPDRLSAATFSHQTGNSASNGQPTQTTGPRLPGNRPTNGRALDNLRSTNSARLGQTRTDFANSTATGQPATGQPTPGQQATAGQPVTGQPTPGQPGSAGLPYIWIDPERVHLAGNYQLNVDVKAPPAAAEPKQQASPKVRSSFLYAGVIVAPDVSMVKMQSVKGVGSTFGILLGYAFNKHWSVETGAYLDRKKYYSSGEYFNTSKVHLPPNSTLLNVNGTCNMWEIPLNLRYNFNPEGRLHWFATAGLSTYLMTGEKYTYAYQEIGSYWGSDSTWNIKRPSQYPFAIVNLSVGLEQRLGKIGFLRIEPYARLPLTGMGTGKLPIMSTGVNIGFVRPLWK